MKKIMVLVAVVAMAAMANAAAVGWTILGAKTYAEGNYSLFVVGLNGVTSVDQMVTLAKAGSDVSAFAFGGGTVTAAGLASVGVASTGAKSITYSGSGTDTYQAFAIVWDKAGTTGSYTSTATVIFENDSTGKTFLFGNQTTNLANNQFEVAPEPTSGLLLLLGVAGLALRRRRA